MDEKLNSVWGLVETFNERELSGWINLKAGSDFRDLSLCVNSRAIQKIRTAGPITRDLPFVPHRFSVRFGSIWRFLGPDDYISVRCEEIDLHIVGHGRRFMPTSSGEKSSKTLFSRLEKGWVLNQKGKIQLSKTVDYEWQRRTFDLYHSVNAHLKKHFGLDLFVIYGTLLGAVRTGQFIGHDHDFDVGFISAFENAEDVKGEAEKIIRSLVAGGYEITVKPSCTYVRSPNIPHAQIDIGRIFFGEHGKLETAFGFAGTTEYRRTDFTGVVPIALSGENVLAPSNPEILLSRIYGDDWRVPNAGFNWDRERRAVNRDARISGEQLVRLQQIGRDGLLPIRAEN